jgi:hypothetical protein
MPDRLRGMVQDFAERQFDQLKPGKQALVLFDGQCGEDAVMRGRAIFFRLNHHATPWFGPKE